ncbi:MAG TPA: BON domain-containing protein [Myxococcales bacterium]|nr:BON domain-containing protein [Myxococcales bacterium]
MRGSTLGFLTGFVAGGVTVALLDPRRGAARRALLRDKGFSAVKDAAGMASRRAKDLRQRLHGVVYEAKARMSEQQVPDDILVERVRAQLGRPVSHPRAIEVRAENGCVVLSGPILAHEAEDLIRRVSKIPGVRSIESQLELHGDAGDVSSLQ